MVKSFYKNSLAPFLLPASPQSLSDRRKLPLASRALGICQVTAWDSGHSPRWRQSPDGGDFPRPTPTTPGGRPPTAPARPPSTPHSPAQRLTWEGTGPGLPSRRRERAASRRSRADERAQAAPTSASLLKLWTADRDSARQRPHPHAPVPSGSMPEGRERCGAACLAAISARRLG